MILLDLKEGVLEEVREHYEEMPVRILFDNDAKRWVIHALNEGGYNSTAVDLMDLLTALHLEVKIL